MIPSQVMTLTSRSGALDADETFTVLFWIRALARLRLYCIVAIAVQVNTMRR